MTAGGYFPFRVFIPLRMYGLCPLACLLRNFQDSDVGALKTLLLSGIGSEILGVLELSAGNSLGNPRNIQQPQ
ncbi:Uncharacterised protein [Mycobacteroides abscessus subsp. abscessus]|nr:Uncharacterised protein [Mycobacteroides abscessus subsp. abscessus]SHS12751.1 Uncharacterised protein [Mycobacteroides abscessus subsp. abscessus]SHS21743.1 Uncharacterised protein [Mycobacteroides abscessus subsp. abscessus]SKD60246.1 Uncharacterised protein [Mycobacteroides abscessus subsp. abscessus]SKH47848.1 Uncharacterised protein [Mycobacteroides abscessus subsp. abscessus]